MPVTDTRPEVHRGSGRYRDDRYNRRVMTAPQSAPPPEPDGSRVFELSLKLGLAPADAYAFAQDVQRMASENLIARFESKLDALAAVQETKLDAIRSELRTETRSIRWVLGGVAIVLTLVFGAGQFGGAYREALRILQGPQVAPAGEQSPVPQPDPAPPTEVP